MANFLHRKGALVLPLLLMAALVITLQPADSSAKAPGPEPTGFWYNFASTDHPTCVAKGTRVCAEWYSDAPYSTIPLCCINIADMNSKVYSGTCLARLGERPKVVNYW